MTGAERYVELYDELKNLVYHLDLTFQMDAAHPDIAGGRGCDPEVLIGRAKAINDVADEMRFLKKFRGTLGLVK